MRHAPRLVALLASLFLASCGGGSSTTGSNSTPTTPVPTDVPTVTSIYPTGTFTGSPDLTLTVVGSNFETTAKIQWNNSALSTTWISPTQITATVPGANMAQPGSANITVINNGIDGIGGGTSSSQSFRVTSKSVASTFVRSVPGIATAKDIAWDSVHQRLYVTLPSSDTVSPNTIVPVDPYSATALTPVNAGNNPHLLSISSDSSYLWVGLDGDNAVQRFRLPGLTKDISIPVPPDNSGNARQPVALQSAPVNPHALGLIAGIWNQSPPGDGVFVFDDAVQRPTSVPGYSTTGTMIDWINWGSDDSTIYGNQYTTIDLGGVATIAVNPSGATLTSYNGGDVGPYHSQYDKGTGLLYSTNRVFKPSNGSQVGQFSITDGERVCTSDSSLGRYYCMFIDFSSGTDVGFFELWVYDLNTYALIDRLYFGASAGSNPSGITGSLVKIVRWGTSGLALITNAGPPGSTDGAGGLFLIDGATIHPGLPPDSAVGITPAQYPWMASLQPSEVSVGTSGVSITIKGSNFTPASTACTNCNFLEFNFLPTTYVSPQQLNVTVPASKLAAPGLLPITVFDSSANQFSTDDLTLTVNAPPSPTSSTTVQSLTLGGLAIAGNPNSNIVYVGTSEFEGSNPNSVVAVDGSTGSVVHTAPAGSNPVVLSLSNSNQYLYVGYLGATTMSQFTLPALSSPLTWTLNNPVNTSVYWAGDLAAAPQDPHTTAVALFDQESTPEELGGIVIYDDNVQRPNYVQGFMGTGHIYDRLAWTNTDQVLTSVSDDSDNGSPLFGLQVTPTGAIFGSVGTAIVHAYGAIHSDPVTGLIYDDEGVVIDPVSKKIIVALPSSGLLAPDSSLNRIFVLGQTQAQANSNSYTIQSFDQTTYQFVSQITIDNLVGFPSQIVRFGPSGLAVLTINQGDGSIGTLYLVRDSSFVSKTQSASTTIHDAAQPLHRRWKHLSRPELQRLIASHRAHLRPA